MSKPAFDVDELARMPVKNAKPSPFEAWAKFKRDEPKRWAKEWAEACAEFSVKSVKPAKTQDV